MILRVTELSNNTVELEEKPKCSKNVDCCIDLKISVSSILINFQILKTFTIRGGYFVTVILCVFLFPILTLAGGLCKDRRFKSVYVGNFIFTPFPNYFQL